MCGQKSVFLEPQGHLAGFTRAINLGTVEERSGLVKLFQPWGGRQRCAMVVWAGKVHASTIDSAIKLVASYVNVQAFGLLGQPFVATVVIWNKVGRCVISRYPSTYQPKPLKLFVVLTMRWNDFEILILISFKNIYEFLGLKNLASYKASV